MVCAISDQGGITADAGEPVPKIRRNPHSPVGIWSPKICDLYVSTSGRALAIIEYNKADPSYWNCQVLNLNPVLLPSFNRAGINFRKVAFTETSKSNRIAAKHMEHSTTMILNLPQLINFNTGDFRSVRHGFVQERPRSRANWQYVLIWSTEYA